MASTAMFAPYDPASAMARRIVAPITGNAYQIDPRGSALVDSSDVAWFQTQGFSATPTASAGQSLMYAPYMADEGMTGPTTNPNTGNTYFINAAGAVAVATADIAWFQTQGYALVPTPGTGFSLMSTQVEVGQALSGPLFSPITGNMYVMNGQGWIIAATADVAWLQGQGFAPVASGSTTPAPTVLSVSPNNGTAAGATPVTITGTNFTGATAVTFGGVAATSVVVVNATTITAVTPAGTAGAVNVAVTTPAGTGTGTGLYTYNAAAVFPPQVSGTNATIAADFAGQQYWASAASQASFAAWLTAIGGTYSRASSATYLQGGVVKTATANTPRFPTDAGGAPQGIRLTGAPTELCLWNRDLTNAAWTQSNVTVALNQIGADGGANSASSLTATAANGTVLQAITSASAARIMGAYVKRLTGTGTINITQDNGATWTAIAPTSSWVFYTLPSATIANPVVGFRIVTNGDAIAVDYVSEQASIFIADVIPTTTATVTQAADSFSFPFTQTTFSALIGTNGLNVDGSGNQIVVNMANGGTIHYENSTQFSSSGAGSVTGPTITNVINPHKTMAAGSPTNTWLTSDGIVPNTVASNILGGAPVTAYIGSFGGSILNSPGNYSQLALWNAIVASTAEMQRLTT